MKLSGLLEPRGFYRVDKFHIVNNLYINNKNVIY